MSCAGDPRSTRRPGAIALATIGALAALAGVSPTAAEQPPEEARDLGLILQNGNRGSPPGDVALLERLRRDIASRPGASQVASGALRQARDALQRAARAREAGRASVAARAEQIARAALILAARLVAREQARLALRAAERKAESAEATEAAARNALLQAKQRRAAARQEVRDLRRATETGKTPAAEPAAGETAPGPEEDKPVKAPPRRGGESSGGGAEKR